MENEELIPEIPAVMLVSKEEVEAFGAGWDAALRFSEVKEDGYGGYEASLGKYLHKKYADGKV